MMSEPIQWKNYDYYKDFVGRTFRHKLQTPLEVTGFLDNHRYMVIRVRNTHQPNANSERDELASMSFIDLDSKVYESLVDTLSTMELSQFNKLDQRIVWDEEPSHE